MFELHRQTLIKYSGITKDKQVFSQVIKRVFSGHVSLL